MNQKNSSVCLIYPGISWSGFGTFGKTRCGECNFIHHGIASIAAVLVNNSIKVEYIDFRKIENFEEFEKIISKSKSVVFGISSTTVDFDYSIMAAKIIKKKKPDSVVVIGGVHPTVRPLESMKIAEFDYVVTGEGEAVMLKIAKGLRPNKKIVVGEPMDLEKIPHVDRELFDHRKGEMVNPFVEDMPIPFATFMSSRGCPFNCSFCQPAERLIFKGKIRLRSIKDFVAEIVEVKKKYGLKSFMIHDDLFLLSKERVQEFILEYRKSGVGAEFLCQARADLVIKYKEQMKLLKEVGLKGVMIGFESGSNRILKYLNKQVTVEQNLEAAKICHLLGIKIWANYMMGVPTESYWEMFKTVIMIKKIKPDYYSPSLFTPYPETKLYEYCEKNGLLLFKKHSEYRRSIKGDKIKGFNYNLIRLLVLFSLRPKLIFESIKAVFK
jgi:anaerobic magnesium-protoporphyrin IX monomethyl ester cyclase